MIRFDEKLRFVGAWFVYPNERPRRGEILRDMFGMAWIDEQENLVVANRVNTYPAGTHPAQGKHDCQKVRLPIVPEEGESRYAAKVRLMGEACKTVSRYCLQLAAENDSQFDMVNLKGVPGPAAVQKLKQFRWFHATGDKNDDGVATID